MKVLYFLFTSNYIFYFFYYFNMIMSKINFKKNIKNIILIYFQIKNNHFQKIILNN